MPEQNPQTKNRRDESRSLERRPSRGEQYGSPSEFFSASPFGAMRRFAENMERALSGEWESAFGRSGNWSPAIDVTERGDKLVVHADLPGLSKDDVSVEVFDNALVIQGERRQEQEENEGGYRRTERRYGSFYRSIPLPEGAETDQARAEFKNGVLEVSVPCKTAQSRGRSVPIEAGSAERKESGTATQPKVSKAG